MVLLVFVLVLYIVNLNVLTNLKWGEANFIVQTIYMPDFMVIYKS